MNPAEGRRRLEEVRQLTRGALAEMQPAGGTAPQRPGGSAPAHALAPTDRSPDRPLTHPYRAAARKATANSADVQVGLYRIAQEALNNVVKHAKASQAVVTLRCGRISIRLTVADNGVGFDPTTVTADHLGLKIMRERVEAIGAKLSVYSEPGEGTQISMFW